MLRAICTTGPLHRVLLCLLLLSFLLEYPYNSANTPNDHHLPLSHSNYFVQSSKIAQYRYFQSPSSLPPAPTDGLRLLITLTNFIHRSTSVTAEHWCTTPPQPTQVHVANFRESRNLKPQSSTPVATPAPAPKPTPKPISSPSTNTPSSPTSNIPPTSNAERRMQMKWKGCFWDDPTDR